MAPPRVGLIDIETAPINALVWQMYQTDVVHVLEPSYMLSYALKWRGESKIKVRALCDYPLYKKDKISDKSLVQELWDDLDEADILIAHNGDAFDIKKINARFVVHNLRPPSPFKTIDTLKIARSNFRFDSNKLDNIGRMLKFGGKIPHTGKDLWVGCMNGDMKSWRTMKKYNAHDVELLEAVYERIKPWHKSHPHLTTYDGIHGCPVCRSSHVQNRGFNVAKTRKTQRLHCQDCGHWWSGRIVR